MPNQIEVIDEDGNTVDLSGRTVATLSAGLDGNYELVLGPALPINPIVDETWTKADVRRLIKLLKKRERLLEQLEEVIRKEHHVEFEAHDSLKWLLDGRDL